MCGGTDSAATVKGTTTKAQDDEQRRRNSIRVDEGANYRTAEEQAAAKKAVETPGETSSTYQEREKEMQGFGIKPPPDAPDAADELLRKRRAAEATSLMLGRGRKDTMRPSTFGDMAIGKSKLYGGGGS
jgi:hypothetical protein